MNTHLILPTTNETWGFFGTIEADKETAWALVFTAIIDATQADPEAVREFLDAPHGRHLADEINGRRQTQDLPAAIAETIEQWMAWKIGKALSKHYGIPRGLPYLLGFVTSYEVAAC